MKSSTDHPAGQQRDPGRPPLDAALDQGGLLVTWGAAGPEPLRATADPTIQSAAVTPLTPDEVGTVVAVAARAPSIHNSQPWRFRPRADCIELLADPDRMLRAVDPAGRELTISCGAALFGLRLGLRQVGRLAAVELQPDPAQPWLVARVRPVRHAARSRVEADLIAAVSHRHTHRGPFSPGGVPDHLLAEMVTDAAAEGCELALVNDKKVITRLARLVREAAAQQQADPAITAELARWVRPMQSQARDGIPATARLAEHGWDTQGSARADGAAGSRPAHRKAGSALAERLPGRDFGLPGTEDSLGEPPSATAVLFTPGDDTADWLRSGQALDRILLRAAARWVFASLQSQPLESVRHRRAVRALFGGRGYPQMVLQLGRANTAIATPRRPRAAVLAPDRAD